MDDETTDRILMELARASGRSGIQGVLRAFFGFLSRRTDF